MPIYLSDLQPVSLLRVGTRLLSIAMILKRSGFVETWRRFAVSPLGIASRRTRVAVIVRCTNGLSRRLRLTCLPRSLALCSLLRERGYPAEVKIGVRREAGQLLAHAWVELDGEALGETLHPDWQVLPMEQAAAILQKVAAPTS